MAFQYPPVEYGVRGQAQCGESWRSGVAGNQDGRNFIGAGVLIGHGADNDAAIATLGLPLVDDNESSWQGLVRIGKLNRGGTPDAKNSLTSFLREFLTSNSSTSGFFAPVAWNLTSAATVWTEIRQFQVVMRAGHSYNGAAITRDDQ